MKLITYLLVGFVAGQLALQAQANIEQQERVDRSEGVFGNWFDAHKKPQAPSLFENEVDDIGPQYLLLEAPKHQFVSLFYDMQILRTSNATLSTRNAGNTTLTVNTAEVSFNMKPRKWKSGTLKARAGIRYQLFRYGLFADDDKNINGTVVDSLDFNSRVGFVEATLERGKWFYQVGIRYNSLVDAHGVKNNSYYEWVPHWSVTRLFPVNDEWSYYLNYSGNWRDTVTDNFGFARPASTNNRTEHAFTAGINKALTSKLFMQPSYRLEWTDYTDPSRRRQDLLHSANLTFSYFIRDAISMRFFSSFERQNSNEFGAGNDYKSINAGIGANFFIRF